MKRSVGPKPTRRLSHHATLPVSGFALTTTFFDSSSCDRAFVSAKAGISVLNWVEAFDPA